MPPTKLRVYDPPMCCSTGVCGPNIDPRLMRFAADLEWLAEQGVTVERFNLAQQPMAFAEDAVVRQALEDGGEQALPVLVVDGRMAASGVYPTRAQLGAWFGKQAGARAAAIETPCCGPAAAKGGCC